MKFYFKKLTNKLLSSLSNFINNFFFLGKNIHQQIGPLFYFKIKQFWYFFERHRKTIFMYFSPAMLTFSLITSQRGRALGVDAQLSNFSPFRAANWGRGHHETAKYVFPHLLGAFFDAVFRVEMKLHIVNWSLLK